MRKSGQPMEQGRKAARDRQIVFGPWNGLFASRNVKSPTLWPEVQYEGNIFLDAEHR